jgi:hypothetical protein
MKCYQDAKAGKDVEAVAVCAVCGKGLCMDHATEKEVEMAHVSPWEVKSATAILCDQCAERLHSIS